MINNTEVPHAFIQCLSSLFGVRLCARHTRDLDFSMTGKRQKPDSTGFRRIRTETQTVLPCSPLAKPLEGGFSPPLLLQGPFWRMEKPPRSLTESLSAKL